MPFVPREPSVPTKPEELFQQDGTDNAAFLVAVLSDGSTLFLSDGPAMNWPSPWPLWYEPFTIEHAGALEWFDAQRAQLLELRPDLTDVYTHSHPRGLGHYFPIKGVELGKEPWLEHKINNGVSWNLTTLDESSFKFQGTIEQFIPVGSRDEGKALTPP